jgi:hypothetical protein
MCLDQRHCVEPWHSAMVVAPGSYSIHPGTCQYSLLCSSGIPSRLQLTGVMSRAVEMARLPWCCVSLKEVWLSHALVALKSSPFSAIACLIRPSHWPCRSGEIQWRRGTARSYQFQMKSADSA